MDFLAERLQQQGRLPIPFSHQNGEELQKFGFTIIDDCFDVDQADQMLEELKILNKEGFLRPNKTHFSSPTKAGQYFLFSKPGEFSPQAIWGRTSESLNCVLEVFSKRIYTKMD